MSLRSAPLPRTGSARWLPVFALAGLLLSACAGNMREQPRYEPYESSSFFPNEQSAQEPVENTVARGQLREDPLLYTGAEGTAAPAAQATGTPAAGDGQAAAEDVYPFRVDERVLTRGQERFNIYCALCHGRAGDGDGMIPRRGFKTPPTFHQDRLRNAPASYYFTVITNGFGAMPSYATEVPPQDRWAIIAYIRALQLSQNATVDDVPQNRRGELEE